MRAVTGPVTGLVYGWFRAARTVITCTESHRAYVSFLKGFVRFVWELSDLCVMAGCVGT